jgi:hypothetical protein
MIFIPQLGLISSRKSPNSPKVAYPLTISRPTFNKPVSQEIVLDAQTLKYNSKFLMRRRTVSRGSTRVSTANSSMYPNKPLTSPVYRSSRTSSAYSERVKRYLGDYESINLYLIPEAKPNSRSSQLRRSKAASVNHSNY